MKQRYIVTAISIFVLAIIMMAANTMFAQTPRAIPDTTSVFAGVANENSANNSFTLGQACPHGVGLTATDAMGDGCLATDAVLYQPWAIVFDSTGNAYVADTNAGSFSYVRKIDAITGVISLFAGGLSGSVSPSPCGSPDPMITALTYSSITAGDGCPPEDPTTGAPLSYFKGIRDLAIDANYLYIDDSSNSKIRKCGLSNSPIQFHAYAHECETIAGEGGSGWSQDGLPTTVQIKNPYAIAVDRWGDVFFADQSGDAIRMIPPTTYSAGGNPAPGSILTVGNCAASGTTCAVQTNGDTCPGANPGSGASRNMRFYGITGLAFDGSGNLNIADSKCYSVYQIANNGSSPLNGNQPLSTLMGAGATGAYGGGSWMPAFTGGVQSSARGVTSAGGNNLYAINGTSVWFYDATDTANGATRGWLHQMWNSASPAGTGCTGSVNSPATTYFGCPATVSTFAAGSQGGHGTVDQYGNLYVADGNDALILKAAIGLDFIGTAPQVETSTTATQTVLLHGAGISDSVDFISSGPFSLAPQLSFAGGAADCSTYSSVTGGNQTDNATDCTYSLTYTPTASGLQTGVLSANGTMLPLDGYGNMVPPPLPSVVVTCSSYAKVYGQPDPAFGYSTIPVVPSWTVAPVCTVAAESGTGPYPITVANCASLAASGFGSFSCVAGQLTVTPATPVLSLSCPDVFYDGNAHSCTGSATGVTGAAVSGTWSFSPASEVNVGTYPVTGTFTSLDANYVSGGTANGTLEIIAPPVVSTPKAIPYMTSLFAGTPGANAGTNPFTVGQACPSGGGKTATDIYGDGCLATEALLYEPWAVVFDSLGNAYIADTNPASYAYVRKVDAVTGVITMFAGGLTSSVVTPGPCVNYTDGSGHTGADPAVTALAYASITSGDGCPAEDPSTGVSYTYFKGIRDLAIDANYLYIDDSSNSKIRKVSLSSSPIDQFHYYAHEVEPVAGTPGGSGWTQDGLTSTVSIKNPYAVTVDSFGNVFFADQSGDAIRRVTPTTYSLVGGVVTPTVGSVLTVLNCAASGNTCAVAVNGAVCPAGSPAGASKNLPAYGTTGLAFDSSGNLYVAEKSCYSVYKIANNGANPIDGTTALTTFMGNGATGSYAGGAWMPAFSGGAQSSMRSVTTAGGSNLYVINNTGVWFYDASDTANGAPFGWLHDFWGSASPLGTGCTTSVGTTTYYGCPAPYSAFASGSEGGKGSIDAYGNLYIADGNDNLILKAATGLDFIGTAPQVQVNVSSPATNTVLLHGSGIGDTDVSTASPFSIAGLLSYPVGGPFTTDCSTYTGASDLETDCTYLLTYTPTVQGLQTGTLTANGTGLALDGYGNMTIPVLPAVGVTCNSYSKTYGQTDPSFGYTTAPVVPAWAVAPVCAVAAEAGAGTYPINVVNCASLAAAGFGSFSCVAGQLTVAQATPTLSLSCQEVLYDGFAHSCTGSATGVTGAPVAGSWSLYPVTETAVGVYTITGTFTSADSNYAGGTASGTLKIDPLPVVSYPKAIPYMTSALAGVVPNGNTVNPFTVGAACPHGAGLIATDANGDGCLATDALLNAPYAVVFDSAGNVYLADNNGVSDVRKIDAVTGVITLFAGGLGGAAIGSPCVAYSANGYTGPDPAITGMADASISSGDGCPGVDPNPSNGSYSYLKGIRDLAIDATSTYLYIDDSSASKIKRISLSNSPLPGRYYAHEVEPVIGFGGSGWNGDGPAVSTQIKNPYAIAVDAFGNVFFADASGNSVRMISNGNVTTIVNGTGTAPLANCAGFAPTGASQTLPLSAVTSLAFDANGNLYLAEKGCHSLRKITPNPSTGVVDGTTAMSTPFGDGLADNTPYSGTWYQAYSGIPITNVMRGVVSAGGGNMYVLTGNSAWLYDVSDTANGAIFGWLHNFFGSVGGGCAANGTSPYVGCPAPEAILNSGGGGGHGSLDAYGNLYVSDYGDNIITKVATGLDFIGTAPRVPVPEGSSLTNTVLLHGAGISDADVTTSAPFSLAGLLSYPAGGPFTSDCSTYGSGTDGATDCTYSLTYTPTAVGLQTGSLFANGTSLTLDAFGAALIPATPILTINCPEVLYDGQPHSCTGTATGIGGITVAGVWNFVPGAETNAGTYLETGMFISMNPNYTNGTATGTLIILPVTPSPWPPIPSPCIYVYDGNPHTCPGPGPLPLPVGVGGLPINGGWSCNMLPETNVGTYYGECILTSYDSNYVIVGGIIPITMIIEPATPTVTVSCPTVVYDDKAHSCTASATGVGGAVVSGTVSFIPGAETAVGSYPEAATFTSTNPDYTNGSGSGTLVITAPVGTPAATINVTSLTFPNPIMTGQSSPAQYVLITSTGSASLQVSGVTMSGTNPGDFLVTNQAGSCTTGATLAYHAGCNLRVIFAPTGVGTRSAILNINDNITGSPQQVLVSGTATSGVLLSLSATTLTFPATTVGATAATQYITIKSTGYQAVVIPQVVLNSGDFDLSDQAGTCTTAATTSLVPGADCNIRVKFHPTAKGARSATVVINDNTASSPHTVTLNGTGQ
jgi:hypothetical protein